MIDDFRSSLSGIRESADERMIVNKSKNPILLIDMTTFGMPFAQDVVSVLTPAGVLTADEVRVDDFLKGFLEGWRDPRVGPDRVAVVGKFPMGEKKSWQIEELFGYLLSRWEEPEPGFRFYTL